MSRGRGRPRTFDHEAAFALYRADVAGAEIARRVGASHAAVRLAISKARKQGVDLGPRRPRTWRPDTPRGVHAVCGPLYLKYRRAGLSRAQAVEAVQAAKGEGLPPPAHTTLHPFSDRHVHAHTMDGDH